mgnify:CR=1 FL=1
MTEEIKEGVSARETIRQNRIQKLAELADKGINPYPYSFAKDADASFLQDKYKDLPEWDGIPENHTVTSDLTIIGSYR